MRFPRSTRILHAQWDAIPFLCVLFPLAFFLLFGSQLVLPPGVAVELPAAESGERLAPGEPRIVLVLDAHGRVYLDNQWVPEAGLVRRLVERRSRMPEMPVVLIHADVAVPHGQVVRIGGLVRQAGVQRVFFMARPSR